MPCHHTYVGCFVNRYVAETDYEIESDDPCRLTLAVLWPVGFDIVTALYNGCWHVFIRRALQTYRHGTVRYIERL